MHAQCHALLPFSIRSPYPARQQSQPRKYTCRAYGKCNKVLISARIAGPPAWPTQPVQRSNLNKFQLPSIGLFRADAWLTCACRIIITRVQSLSYVIEALSLTCAKLFCKAPGIAFRWNCNKDCLMSAVCCRNDCTTVAMLLQGLCTICCSARTCELYDQKDKDSTSYVATTRGKPAGDMFEHSINLPAARKVVLRMLSLAQRGILHIHRIQLAPKNDADCQHEAPADQISSLQHHPSRESKSQQAEVQAMLQQLMSSG